MSEKPVVLITPLVGDMPPRDQALLTGTLEALYCATLDDVIDVLATRVIGPTPSTPEGERRDARLVDGLGHLREFPTLLLLELQWVARVDGWSTPMRTRRALEAIDLCGF